MCSAWQQEAPSSEAFLSLLKRLDVRFETSELCFEEQSQKLNDAGNPGHDHIYMPVMLLHTGVRHV